MIDMQIAICKLIQALASIKSIRNRLIELDTYVNLIKSKMLTHHDPGLRLQSKLALRSLSWIFYTIDFYLEK